jgi:hypothetical protein
MNNWSIEFYANNGEFYHVDDISEFDAYAWLKSYSRNRGIIRMYCGLELIKELNTNSGVRYA